MDDDEDQVAFGMPILISLFDSGGDLPPFQHGLGAMTDEGGPAQLITDDAVEPCILIGKPEGDDNIVRTSDVVSLWSRGLTLSVPPGGGPLSWAAQGASPSTFVLKGVGDGGKALAVNAIFTLRHEAAGDFVICTQRALASGELGLACLPAAEADGSEAWFTVDGVVDSGLVEHLPLPLDAGDITEESDAGQEAAEVQPSLQGSGLPVDAAELLEAPAMPEASPEPHTKAADAAPAASGIRRMSPKWLRRSSRSRSPPAANEKPASAAAAAAAAAAEPLPPGDVTTAHTASQPSPPPPAPAAAGGSDGSAAAPGAESEFSCEIGEGPLGVTLRLSAAGRVVFSGVQAGGQGARVGISDGDLLLELQGDSLRQKTFDEAGWADFIARVRSSERPLRLRVGRGGGDIEAKPIGTSPNGTTKAALPPPPRAVSVSPRPAKTVVAGLSRGPPLRQGPVRVYRPGALWSPFSSRQLLLFPEELVLRPAPAPQQPQQPSPRSGKGGGGLGSCMSLSDPADPKVEQEQAGADGAASCGGVEGLLASVDEEDAVFPLATVKVRLPRPPTGSPNPRRDPAFQHSFDLLSPFGCQTLCFSSKAAMAEWVAALSHAIRAALEGHLAVPMALGCLHQVVLGTLHSAVVCGDTSLAMELLSSGADPSALDASGLSPVHLAAAFWHHSLLSLLCQRGGSPSAPVSPAKEPASAGGGDGDAGGGGPSYGSGGSNGAADLAGATPLHLACRRAATAMATGSAVTPDLTSTLAVLLRLGARPNAADAAGATPLDVLLGAAGSAGGKLPSESASASKASEELCHAVEALMASGARVAGKEEAVAARVAGKATLERAGKTWKTLATVDATGLATGALSPESWAAAEASEAAAGGAGDAASGCASCGVGFTVFRREHHCRVCGSCVCGACSSKTAMLAGASDPARTCDGCFNRLRGAAAAGASASKRGKAAAPAAAAAATAGKRGPPNGASEEKEKQELFSGAARKADKEDNKGAAAAATGGVKDMEHLTSQLREGLTERGEKLANMADKSDQLLDSASKFADMAKALNQKQSSWW